MIHLTKENKRRLIKLAAAGDQQAAKELKEIFILEKPWKHLIKEPEGFYLYEGLGRRLITNEQYEHLRMEFNIFLIE